MALQTKTKTGAGEKQNSKVGKSRETEKERVWQPVVQLADWWKSRFCGRYQADTAVKAEEDGGV